MANRVRPPHISHGLIETIIHVGIWLLCVIKLLHSLYKTSKGDERLSGYVQNGWDIFARKQDRSDAEWMYWKEMVSGTLWKWFALHIILVQVMRWSNAHWMRRFTFIFFSSTFLMFTLGPGLTLFYFLQIITVNLVAYLSASCLAVWGVSLMFLLLLVVPGLKTGLMNFGLFYMHGDIRFYFQEYLLTMGFLRYVGSALFIVSAGSKEISSLTRQGIFREEKISDHWQWSDIMCYNLYFPLSVFGPLVSFEEFFVQFGQGNRLYSRETIIQVAKMTAKSLLWYFVMEMGSHFFYYNVLMDHPEIMSSVSLWSIAAAGYLTGQMFMVKYLILWSSISAVALLDNISTLSGPCCISRIYLYSDMWKMFDRGLYGFLKRHIYIPIGGNKHGNVRRRVASLTSFAFVLLWHGVTNAITIWIVVNLVSLFCEEILLLNAIVLQKLNLSPTWSRRLHSVVNIPILGLSTFGIFIFLGGLESACVICYRILTEEQPNSLILLSIIAYSMIQTGKDCENYLHAKELHKSRANIS